MTKSKYAKKWSFIRDQTQEDILAFHPSEDPDLKHEIQGEITDDLNRVPKLRLENPCSYGFYFHGVREPGGT